MCILKQVFTMGIQQFLFNLVLDTYVWNIDKSHRKALFSPVNVIISGDADPF